MLSPLSCVNVTHTNEFKEANEQQWQSGTVVVKHLQPVLSRMLTEEETNNVTEPTDASCKKEKKTPVNYTCTGFVCMHGVEGGKAT